MTVDVWNFRIELSGPAQGCQGRDSLFVEGAAPACGTAILAQALGQLLVQGVGQEQWDPLPGQDQDHDHGRLAVVPRTLSNQAQQLLLIAAPSDHLQQSFGSLFAKHRGHLTSCSSRRQGGPAKARNAAQKLTTLSRTRCH